MQSTAHLTIPQCPQCGSAMVPRIQRPSGRAFWGCPTYPRCRGTRPVDGAPPPLDAQVQTELRRLRLELARTGAERDRLLLALRQAERALQQRPAAPAARAERQLLGKALTRLVSVVHPDRWQDHPCALELTKQVVALRERLQEHRL